MVKQKGTLVIFDDDFTEEDIKASLALAKEELDPLSSHAKAKKARVEENLEFPLASQDQLENSRLNKSVDGENVVHASKQQSPDKTKGKYKRPKKTGLICNSSQPHRPDDCQEAEHSDRNLIDDQHLTDYRVPPIGIPGNIDYSTYAAMDCEFVGTGPKGRNSALGRCTIVGYDGSVICDIYSIPDEKITDFRTKWSGLRPGYLKKAIPYQSARSMIKRILKGKIVVGHALENDLGVLQLRHPEYLIRDTSRCKLLQRMAMEEGKPVPKSLKKLANILLERQIQVKTHCSLEDARATLDLFKLVHHQWEIDLAQKKTLTRSRKRTLSETSVDNSFLSDAYWPTDI